MSSQANDVEQKVYSIAEFCKAHRISRGKFYQLPADQRPKEIRIGRRRLISAEAAAEWRRRMEANA